MWKGTTVNKMSSAATTLIGRFFRSQWRSRVSRQFSTNRNAGYTEGPAKQNPPRNWFYLVSLLIVGVSGGFWYRRNTERRRTHKYTLAEAVQETRSIIMNLKVGFWRIGLILTNHGALVISLYISHCQNVNPLPNQFIIFNTSLH